MSAYGDSDFWEQYELYLSESSSRHKSAVDTLLSIRPDLGRAFRQSLLDLGCGKTLGAHRLFGPHTYVGVDKDPPEGGAFGHVQEGDYRECSLPQDMSAFVSLFSSEVTAGRKANCRLYERIFQEVPTIDVGMVSGFYYRQYAHLTVVEETGGIVSHQATWEKYHSDIFREYRLETDAPSTMFGEDVVEVWKLLVRAVE